MKHQRKLLSLLALLACIGIVIFLFFAGNLFPNLFDKVNGSVTYEKDVTDFSDAVVKVNNDKQSVFIKVYTSENGEKYLFLPTWTVNISFENLSDKCEIEVNGEKTKHEKNILVDSDLSICLLFDGTRTDELTVYKSENIGALFVDCEVEQEQLDGVIGEKYGANCHLYDGTGKPLVNEKLEYIKPRGNSTFIRDKKPYEIKFLKSKVLWEKESASEWVLLANDLDKTLLKNHMVNIFAENYLDEIIHPVGDFVDVYINGDYRGNYYMCTKSHDKGQSIQLTDLDELNKQVNTRYAANDLVFGYDESETAYGVINLNSYKDITGGYLVELVPDEQLKTSDAWFKTSSGSRFKIRMPKYATLEEAEYIRDYFDELEEAVSSESGINKYTGKSISDYIDLDSYTSRYFVDLLFGNSDSNQASSFFYKDADIVDGKIYAGPLWDYDLALYEGKEFNVKNVEVIGANYLCERLMNNQVAHDSMVNKYDLLREKVEFDFPSFLYRENKRISKSRDMNHIRWDNPRFDSYAFMDNTTQYLKARLDVIEERIINEDPYCCAEFYDIEGNLLTTREVKKGETIEDIPKCISWTSVFNGWFDAETGKELNKDTRIYKDTKFNSSWIGIDIIVQNGIDVNNLNIETADIPALEAAIANIKARQESQEE